MCTIEVDRLYSTNAKLRHSFICIFSADILLHIFHLLVFWQDVEYDVSKSSLNK